MQLWSAVSEVRPFSVVPTSVAGLMVVAAKQVTDERGVVREFYRESDFRAAGLPSFGAVPQINVTESGHGVIRGIHAELMTKYVGVAAGSAFGVYVDLRAGSATYGRVETVELEPGRGVLVPRGVGNGFQVTSRPGAQYLYCFDTEWAPGMPGRAVNPLDPALGIAWPVAVDGSDAHQISEKDRTAPALADVEPIGSEDG